jgi:hypothetical protein
MAGFLTEEREALAQLAGETLSITAHAFLPGRIVPPCAVVVPASPYITRQTGDPFGQATAQFELWLVCNQGENEVATEQLDEWIAELCPALHDARFAVETVNEPFMYQVQGGNYLTTSILTTTGVSLT